MVLFWKKAMAYLLRWISHAAAEIFLASGFAHIVHSVTNVVGDIVNSMMALFPLPPPLDEVVNLIMNFFSESMILSSVVGVVVEQRRGMFIFIFSVEMIVIN